MMWASTSSRFTVGAGTPSRAACRVICARLLIGDRGQQFVDGSWPAHAPPAIPQDWGPVGSGFEVEVMGLVGVSALASGSNAKASASEPSRRGAAAQPNRRACSMRISAWSSGAAA